MNEGRYWSLFFFLKYGCHWITKLGDVAVDNQNQECRISVRVPQYLKDRVVEESRRLNIGQSDLVRMVLSLYFENKDGGTNG